MKPTVLTQEERDKLVARVLDDMNAMPKVVAAVQASTLYSRDALQEVTDPMLKVQLCRALATYFAGTTAAALPTWESFK